jgi:hypothetical protein
LPWVYFGLGERSPEAAHPAHLPMLLSGWRPAPVLRALAEAGAERGSYEVWTRQLGLVAGPRQGPRTPLLADTSALSRYAHVTPDYVMGSILAPRLPMARWTTISSQNRWHGVTLAGGPGAVLFALPVPRNGRTSYNATLAAQSRGTQIIQRLEPPFSRGAGELLIQAGAGLRLVERGGWVFAEAGGYVAARAAFGGQVAEGGGYRPLDPRAPVIIQAGTRATYRGFAAFQAAVLAAPLRVTAGFVEFEGLEGAGRLRAYLDSDRPPERDGQPLHAPEGWSLHSPFLRQRLGERLVEISHGGQRLTLRF